MGNTFEGQVLKLRLIGLPKALLTWTWETLMKLFRYGKNNINVEVGANRQRNVAVIPYVHGSTYRLKKVGLRYGVQIATTTLNMLLLFAPE